MPTPIYDAIDAAQPSYHQDTLRNLISGLGTEKDKATGGRFERRYLDYAQIDAMYSGDWVAATAVDAIADDMTREWRTWHGSKASVSKLVATESRFHVRAKVNKAIKQSRAYGGAAMLIGDGSADPSQPLDVDAMPKGALRYLHVLSRNEISCGPMVRDPTSEFYGEPEYYQLTGALDGAGVMVHPSRVVPFIGIPHLEASRAVDCWGESVLQRVYDAVRNAAAGAQGGAALVQEAKVDVFKIKNLTANSANATWRQAMLTRMALAALGKSISNTLLMDAEELYEQKKISLADIPAMMMSFLEICAGAVGMPMTRLLGKSPGGLGSNGAAEIRHYYDTCSSRQETDLRGPMSRLDRVLKRHALGSEPAGLDYRWNPLWQLTAAEKAEIALQNAQASQVLLATGLVPFAALAVAVQSQLSADGVYPGFDAALAEELAAGRQVIAPVTPPDDGSKVKNPGTVNKVATASGDE